MSPTDWETATLRDVANFSSGKTPSRSRQADYFDKGTVPWVKTMDLTNAGILQTDECVTQRAISDTKLAVQPPGTVLVAMYGGLSQIGRTGVLRIPAATNQAITAILPYSRRLNADYLLHFLNHNVGYWRTVASSSRKDPNITKADVKAFPLWLPSIAGQETIAAVLDDTDQLLAALTVLIAKREAIQQGMMQQLLTGRTKLKGFTAPWKKRKLQDLLVPRVERYIGGEPLEVLSCTKHQGFVRSLDYFKNQVFSRDLSGYRVIRRGDIGYPANHVEEGSIGVQEAYDAALVSPIYVVMSPLGEVDTYFLQRLLKLDYFRQEFARVTNASVNRRGSLRWAQFSQIEVHVPDSKEQQAVSRCLRDSEAEMHALYRRLAKVRAEKQGMMQQLLTGRTRLPVQEAAV